MSGLNPSALDQMVCLMDAPRILDCSVTPIPAIGSSPLQVVASLPRNVTKILVNDGVGSYIGLYTGPAGAEELRCVIGSGTYLEISVHLGERQRISLRSESSAISSGTLCITFVS